MGRFDISPEVAEEWRGKFRESVHPHVDGEVLAVGPFRRTGAGTSSGPKAKEEAACWDRAGLRVGTERPETTTRVTLEIPDGQKVVCDQEVSGTTPGPTTRSGD